MIRLKLNFGNEIRRTSLSYPRSDLTFSQLHKLFVELFTLTDEINFKISWIDDENEIVSISSDAELQEAIRVMENEKIFKFTASRNEIVVVPRCSECQIPLQALHFRCSVQKSFYLCPKCEFQSSPQAYPMIKMYCLPQTQFAISIVYRHLEKGLQSLLIRHNSSQTRRVHYDTYCAMCGLSPIRGIRYKCLIRSDFDFCVDCERCRKVKSPVLKIYSTDQCLSGSITVGIDPNVLEYYFSRFETAGESIPSDHTQQSPHCITLEPANPLHPKQHSVPNITVSDYFSGGLFIPRGESYTGDYYSPSESLSSHDGYELSAMFTESANPPVGQAPVVSDGI